MTPAKLVPAIHSIAIISLFRARSATGPISAQGLYSRKNLRKRMPFRNGPESGGKMAALSSHLLVGPRMAVSFGIELHDSFMDGTVEVLRSGEGLVGEVMSLQIAPEDL